MDNYHHEVGIEVSSWVRAETKTRQIIAKLRPTVRDEEFRKGIISFLKGIFNDTIVGCKAHVYGSTPLKTYLREDGDIDISICRNVDPSSLINQTILALVTAQVNEQFKIKHPIVISGGQANRILKFSVNGVDVDVSFNKVVGINTLCFLDRLDQHIGRDHLLKESILLVKAWALKSDKVLGGGQRALTTYALQVLLVFIINGFKETVPGPLMVLYTFLEYFKNFDWDKSGIAIGGMANKSLLLEGGGIPDSGHGLLLGEQVLSSCIEEFSVPSTSTTSFRNSAVCIVDPLSRANNLGQSFGSGNIGRMASSLRTGAEELQNVLRAPDMELKVHHYLTQKLKIEDLPEVQLDELAELSTNKDYYESYRSLGPDDYRLPVCNI